MWSHKTGSRRGQVVARPVLTVYLYCVIFCLLLLLNVSGDRHHSVSFFFSELTSDIPSCSRCRFCGMTL